MALTSGSTTVSCDPAIVKADFRRVDGHAYGNMWFNQDSVTQGSNNWVRARKDGGGTLAWKLASPGSSAQWTGVSAGNYYWSTKRSAKKDCNGVLPGDGNYTLNYTVGY